MSTYLLLRSNKQTGPYSLDQMRELGLKAYDLVWIDGKSAAWRYPGEIEELKSFSPPVEEQPFDRFFKRPTQINQPLFPNSQAQKTVAENRMAELPKARPENGSLEPRPIFASLPVEEEKGIVAKASIESKQLYSRLSVQEKPQPFPAKDLNSPIKEQTEYLPRVAAAGVSSSEKREILWEEDSFVVSKGLKKNLPLAPKPPASKELQIQASFLKPFAVGFGLAAFLAIGIFIGLSINNRGNNSPKDIAVKEDMTGPSQQTLYHPKTIPRSGAGEQLTEKKADEVQSAGNEPDAVNAEAIALARKKAKAKQRIADSLKLIKPAPVVDSGALVAAAQVVHATESASLKKDLVKNNISEYVSLTGNKYSVGTFGGISELQLTISNRSAYPLDLVVVEVLYIQSNKKIFKTENIYYRNIGAGAELTEEAPKSSRGVKVQYKITLINSKELGLAYTGI
jgi:hypothetical protein